MRDHKKNFVIGVIRYMFIANMWEIFWQICYRITVMTVLQIIVIIIKSILLSFTKKFNIIFNLQFFLKRFELSNIIIFKILGIFFKCIWKLHVSSLDFVIEKKKYYMNDKVLLPKRVLKLLHYSCKFVVAVFVIYCKFP